MFRILVVEDDTKLLELILLNLRKWGFETRGVEDFSKVMEAVEEQDPHLVLLDINLPMYDGFYWCRKIRSVSKRPIIFISSRGANMDVVMAVNMGGDDFVQKPFFWTSWRPKYKRYCGALIRMARKRAKP